MGKKSRHYRDESDPLLAFYGHQIAASSSIRSYSNPLHSSSSISYPPRPPPPNNNKNNNNNDCYDHGGAYSKNDVDPRTIAPKRSSSDDGGDGGEESTYEKSNIRKRKKKKGYRVHRVSYTPQDHVQVMFRMYGSAFPQVLPFCIGNIIWAVVVIHLKNLNVVDLTFHSSVGHSFMGLLVSFLIVSRSKISYDRFMNYRRHLAKSYLACRELAQFTTVYTFQTQTPQAKEWRQNVCFRTIVLLRVTMDALLWSSTERENWEEEYYTYKKSDGDILLSTHPSSSRRSRRQPQTRSNQYNQKNKEENHDDNGGKNEEEEDDDQAEEEDDDDDNGDLEGQDDQGGPSEHFFRFRALTHGRRSMIDENFRAPISFCHVLRQTIMEHPQYLGYKMPVNEYRDLLNFVTLFNEAFHEFRVLVFTPYPFPLVQMTRTFLFFWVYSLPLVLLKEYRILSSLIIISFVTLGFIGIEYVSMALDDPFGDDTNDVDEHGMALLVYEDIYLAIYRTDGPAAASQLRERVLQRYKQGRGLDCYRNDLKQYEFWEPSILPRR